MGCEVFGFIVVFVEFVCCVGLLCILVFYCVLSWLLNVFVMGSFEDSMICVIDGLFEIFDGCEFVSVFVYEIGYIVYCDFWIMGFVDVMLWLVLLVSWMG